MVSLGSISAAAITAGAVSARPGSLAGQNRQQALAQISDIGASGLHDFVLQGGKHFGKLGRSARYRILGRISLFINIGGNRLQPVQVLQHILWI